MKNNPRANRMRRKNAGSLQKHRRRAAKKMTERGIKVYRRVCVDEENDEWNTVSVPSKCTAEDILQELHKQGVDVEGRGLADFTNINNRVSKHYNYGR